ncbi:MAG: hypothetical protein ACFN3I_13325, partial [Arachnia propionica]
MKSPNDVGIPGVVLEPLCWVVGEPVESLLFLVEVKSSPILVNGDTTTYFVSRFSTGREKTLTEVVNNLPGVRYDEK